MMIRNDDSDSEEFDIDVRSMDSDDDAEVGVNLEDTPEFIELCRVARSLDVNALRTLNSVDRRIFMEDDRGNMIFNHEGISPTYHGPLAAQMVMEGNDEAIAMLLREFNIKHFVIEAAIETYFAVKKFDKIEALLTAYPKPEYQKIALEHYAMLGMTENVDALLALAKKPQLEDWIKDTQYIYALFGHVQQAESLLTRGGKVETLIDGYARGGHFDKVNAWIESKSRNQRLINRMAALSGLIDGHFIKNEERLLKALSHIDSNATRVFLMEQPRIAYRNFNKTKLLRESKRLNHIMREYHFSYEKAVLAAEVLAKPGFREWLLQARQKGSLFDNRMPHDVFISVAMKITRMSYLETEALYLAVCRNTHDGAKQRLLDKHSLFANNKKQTHHKKRERDEPLDIEKLYDVKMRRVGK